ncbi:DUF3152 domain-containing protein [Actinacidiphila acididurans]|uniref:DUF3152 domain-containing protein n=1 Tax=Actinacidiphila acididurans TaxID=2784346 RepID=A0ABS2TZC0_9ACTN|nr:DUF3152 domain-containing protein [Actinacidiphila acididurans]MBM9507851.1 DUF3152 domain-containing protein [Actinacidiphila acididurans]
MRSARERNSASSTGSAPSAGTAPSTGSATSSRRGRRHDRSSHHRGRPRRWGRGWLIATVLAAGLFGSLTTYVMGGAHNDPLSSAPPSGAPPHRRFPAGMAPPSAPAAAPTIRARRPTATPTPTSGETSDKTSADIDVPETGSGTFVTADAGGTKVGQGPHPLRYVVEIETGIDIAPTDAAKEIAGILAAPRGWTHDPDYAFQLVSAGAPHDLTVRIATPGTTDALCWAGIHQDTEGEYDCEVPDGVIVNLKRWVKGSPTFDGPIHDYRALIINHEMGHFLGWSHMTCPGPGRLAPVMMQQIKGLHGCRANAWPYDEDGDFISGPPA